MESTIPSLRAYYAKSRSSYSKRWPRPWPCGAVWLNWDLRKIQPGRYALDPSNGLFTLDLNCSEDHPRTVQLSVFVDWVSGIISATTNDSLELESIVYSPEVDGMRVAAFDASSRTERPDLLPAPKTAAEARSDFAEFSNFQVFPATGPTDDLPSPPRSGSDRNYFLLGRVAGEWSVEAAMTPRDVSLVPAHSEVLRLDIAVATPRDIVLSKRENTAGAAGKMPIPIAQTHIHSSDELDTPAYVRHLIEQASQGSFNDRQKASEDRWRKYWSCSAVKFENVELEAIWYHNTYFLASCLKMNKVAPGLFANWSTGDIGTAWHGDYRADFNLQQVYWGVFSSNHPDMHQPYIELCENLLAMSEKFARDKFNMPGACFPLSSFPVASPVFPYPRTCSF